MQLFVAGDKKPSYVHKRLFEVYGEAAVNVFFSDM